MQSHPSRRYIVAALAGSLPFAFATIRAITTGGRDLRYLWGAVAACAGAAIVTQARTADGTPTTAALTAAAALVVSATSAATIGWLLGSMLGPGLLIVATAFASCNAAAVLVLSLSAPRGRP